MRWLPPWRQKATAVNQADEPPHSITTTSRPKKVFPSGIKTVHDPETGLIDIVFIHGLTGDRERTWTAHDVSEPWPKSLLPSKVPTARILTFGYDAYVTDWRGVVSENRIANHAWNLLTSLARHRDEDNTALVISRQRSERHLQSILRSTRGIIFLGTPHHGAGLARGAELLCRSIGVVKQRNAQIVEVLRRDSEVLARIQDSFHTMVKARVGDGLPPIEISCFYKELPLQGIGLVVPQESAILPGYIPIGIRGNHMEMAKFAIHVPYPRNETFVGRALILEKLQQQPLKSASQARVSLFGLGGIGKTHIALEYAYWLQETNPEISVFWVHASNAERFRQSFTSIALECRIPGYTDPKVDVLPLVKRWLERKDRGWWAMILDNADDEQLLFPVPGAKSTGSLSQEESFGQYVPESTYGSILVTTRNKQAGIKLAKGKPPIEVHAMDDHESEQLLRANLTEIDATSSQLLTLSSRVEHVPLALAQAAAFIEANSMAVSQYLELLGRSDQNLVDLLSEEFETVGRDSEIPRAVAETWILSFEQIQRQNAFAGELLSLMSFFDRQAIPIEFLVCEGEQKQKRHSEIELQKALGILKAFSFITAAKDGNLDMHRLVQGIFSSFARQALMAGTGSRYEMAGKATLLHRASAYFYYKGQWKDAERLQLEAVKLKREVLGEEDPSTLASMGNLALIFRNQGRLEEAEKLGVEVMETRKRKLGADHPDTLISMGNLAFIFHSQGRLEEAEKLGVEVMETRKRKLGADHPYKLRSTAALLSLIDWLSEGRKSWFKIPST
ncbi:hypothetical protein GQ53DRAFT_780118 [Thozetella sp. PMI_491]|nr:hypothetical protein GQ53DRAFT_780118 [Thozetella sp. PMI_491]